MNLIIDMFNMFEIFSFFLKIKINSKINISSIFSKLKRWLLMQLLMLYLMHIVPSMGNPYYGYYTKSKSTQKILKTAKKCIFSKIRFWGSIKESR